MPDSTSDLRSLELPPLEEVEQALDLEAADRAPIPGLYNLNVERVPIRRLIGMQVLLAFAVFHNVMATGGGVGPRMIWVAVILELYAGTQFFVLRRYFTRFERFHLGTFFLIADVPIFTVAIWGTGGASSWLWPLYLIRVADQMWIGRQRAALMAYIALGAYLALLGLLATFGGESIVWSVELLKIMILGTLAAYLVSIADLPWNVQEKTHAAKELILRLEEQSVELDAARQRAELASISKSTFLARMSHELRTPLNSVVGFTNVLLKKTESFTGRERDYLQRIRQNGMHLLALINDVLDIARIEEGKVDMNLSELDLEQLVRDTGRQLEGRLVDSRIRLTVAFPRDLKPIVADEARLRQVLINLIGNAIKFTEEGFVRVEVDADDNGHPTKIRVVDSGIGIDSSRLEHIFDAFEQEDGSTARRFGGTGLGLSISRSLCALMKFELTAESEVKQGSTFTVLLQP